MNITLNKNNLLCITTKDGSDVITLVPELKQDCNYSAIITLANGVERVFPFSPTNIENVFKAKLSFTKEDLLYITVNAFIRIYISGSNFACVTNSIAFEFDTNSYDKLIIKEESKDIVNLTKEVIKLKKLVNDLLKGKVLTNISIENKEYLKPGMVPVAVDDQGNFMAEYPFNNLVEELNNMKPIDGKLLLTSGNIPHKATTVEETLNSIVTTLEALNQSILTLTEQQKNLRTRIDNLELTLERMNNSSII